LNEKKLLEDSCLKTRPMLSKAATVTSVRREISHMELRKNSSRVDPKKDKEFQKQDENAQKSFWLGVTTATAIIQQDNLSKKIQKSRMKPTNNEKIIHDNSKEVSSSPPPPPSLLQRSFLILFPLPL
jgi:hypothetical protein